MFLTEDQLHELQKIIADHHSAFVANFISPGSVPRATLDRLQKLGLVNVKANTSQDAYTLGVLAAKLSEDKSLQNVSYAELKARLKRDPVPLTPVEKQAVQAAQLSAGQYIQGIGVRMAQYVGSEVLQTDAESRLALQTEVRTQTEQAIAQRQSIGQLVSNLGHATLDWTRDLRRVANTEMSAAMNRGIADQLIKEDGPDAEVVVLANPDCCVNCRIHYEQNGRPVTFKLGELMDNGVNVGRTVDDYLPTLPPLHPHCRCVVHKLPRGMAYDKNRMLVPDAMAY